MRWLDGPASEIFCSKVRAIAAPCRPTTVRRRRAANSWRSRRFKALGGPFIYIDRSISLVGSVSGAKLIRNQTARQSEIEARQFDQRRFGRFFDKCFPISRICAILAVWSKGTACPRQPASQSPPDL